MALLEEKQSDVRTWVDVTPQSVFIPEDDEALKIDEQGAVIVQRGGRHTLVVRFLNLVATSQVTEPLALQPLSELPAAQNWIDERIHETLQQLRLPAAERASDAQLVRRLSLDLTGRLPSAELVNKFTNSTEQQKYEKLVDQLLASSQFADYWTYQLSEWLRVHAPGGSDLKAADAFHEWLRLQVQSGTGLDRIGQQLLMAEGDSRAVGPATFYRLGSDARQQAEYVSEALLGIRLRCANCHNHPLDRWTQDDYHGLAAIFARIDTGTNVRLKERGEVIHPATGEPARPRIPGERFLEKSDDGRAVLAAWLTADDNPHFARATVNRIWKTLMGRGLIEPVDDLRDTNPATHPRLLEDLARDFRENHCDLRHTIRSIVLSAAYQRSSDPPSTDFRDDRFYSHYLVRPLPPAVLADAIDDITGVPSDYRTSVEGGENTRVRAVTISDPQQAPILEVLGACARNANCDGAAATAPLDVTARLHLFNGKLLNGKLQSSAGRLPSFLDEGRTNTEIVCAFYLSALSRVPREDELMYWNQQLSNSTAVERRKSLEDFVWALLNCHEFVTNH
jgi:hypothetical protein